ncbi:MAG: family 78 glycoside hydrolase catalytic domain [Prevotella sp.]|nr:family 78 glycoside hydrolase catalytic domain [Prevotella sp.]
MRRVFIICLLLTAGLMSHAQLMVTKTTCNYQSGHTAIVEEGVSRVGWQYVNGDIPSLTQEAYQIEVLEHITGELIYDSGPVRSTESQFIELPHLSPNQVGYDWHVRICHDAITKKGAPEEQWSPWSAWQTIRVVPSDLFSPPTTTAFDGHLSPTPRWIGAITKAASHIPEGRWSNEVFKKDSFKTKWEDVDTLSARSILLRKTFLSNREVADAVVYVSGLGHYKLFINGFSVGDSEFAPLWSEYSRTVYYNTYDVTRLLQLGANAVTVLLGNGFFNVQRGSRYSKLQASFGPPQLLLRLDITYTDGTTEHVFTDESWRWTPSPITFNSIYGGESYDARLIPFGCDLPEYDDGKWFPAVAVEGPAGKLRPETAPPVRVMERYAVKSTHYIDKDSLSAASAITKREVRPGTFVCDMGQNLSGFPEITVSGRPGQTVTLLVSERLTPQGACDQSQTGRPHYYEYTLGGNGRETWHPTFSYYGFRYIQVEGAVEEGKANPDSLPVLHSLHSCFVYNSARETSTFWCDNDLMTRTHRLIERAERSNMQGVLTDCPQREKLGWLEQDHLCGPSLLYNYDMTTLIPKIIRDIVDTQKADGMVPTTAPQYVSFGNLFDDSPEWGSTLVILPFMYYDMYGDSTLIVDNYEPMRRYVDYLTSRSEDGIVSHGLGDWYDYGPRRPGFSQNTPVPLVATAHYIYDLQLVAEAARMAGHPNDAARYRARHVEVVEAFNRHFYHADSCYYGSGSQTSNALPLFLGITGEHKEAVLQSLIADIHAHGDRLTTGDVGNRYLFRVLADNGCNELLFKMLNHYETPGYGFQLVQGATTLTEQWDPRQGSSENHFMLGQIDEWFFRTLAGIRQKPGTHGMRHLVIDPLAVGDITKVKASMETLYGRVTIDFNKKDTTLFVSAPPGCVVENAPWRRPLEQWSAHLFPFAATMYEGGEGSSLIDYSHCYDPQLPAFWMGGSMLYDGVFGSKYEGFHLRPGVWRKMEFGFTFLQVSRNLYRGVFGVSTALQFAIENYEFQRDVVAVRKGYKTAFEPAPEKLRQNYLNNFSIRIPLLLGVQTRGRELSLQTGLILHGDRATYKNRYPDEKEAVSQPFHGNHFRASWTTIAGIGPVTLSFTQSLVPLFRLTNGVKAYPSSLTVGFDMWYWDRRLFREKKKR